MKARFIAAGLLVTASLFLFPLTGSARLPAPPPPPLVPPLLVPVPPPVVVIPGTAVESREGRREKRQRGRAEKRESRHGKSYHGRGHERHD